MFDFGHPKVAADLHVTSSLRVTMELKLGKNTQYLSAGKNSLGHQATDSSSIVARIVGLPAKPSSERSSPSR